MRRIRYIHERPGWPEFTWDSGAIGALAADVRHRQGRVLGRMEGLGFELRREASVATLTADVLKSSAIEGEHLDPGEVRSSVARRLGLDVGGLPRAGRNVDAVVEMMLDATQRFREPLTADRLYGWHAALFPTGRSGVDAITVGAWRTGVRGPMRVVSGPIGREIVHFEAPEAGRLGLEMRRFLKWFGVKPACDSLVFAGIAHLWFVTIHPFEDGNGRIARAITDMALARSDGSRERFYSVSAEIEREKKRYYDELESQQKSDVDITRWLAWFLGCVGRALDASEQGLESVLRKAKVWERVNRRPVNERQRMVINLMLGDFEGFLNTSKYSKLAKCSSDTALRDIQDLVARGIVVRNASGGRSTSYRLNDPEKIPVEG